MSTIERHYTPEDPTEAVLAAIKRAGHDPDHLAPDVLAPLEDFHIGGRRATEHLAELAGVEAGLRALDVGCGLGGPVRYLAGRGCDVVGIDLAPMFVTLANELNRRAGLGDQIKVELGDATAMHLPDAAFDLVWIQHVGMNIADKTALLGEVHRVLRLGGKLALFDIMAGDGRPLHMPVPWAARPEDSFLAEPSHLRALLEDAGLAVTAWEDASNALRDAVPRPPPLDGPPPLSPALYIPDAAARLGNAQRNLAEGRIRVVYAVAEAS
jgi:SAM-dependent methyltransferase